MASATLSADARTDSGTGAARKLRQSGKIPAIIYGHGREPQSLTIDMHELTRLLDRVSAASTVIDLSVDGRTARTLIREIQRHPFKKQILHLDFQELVAGEKVTVDIPIVLVGTPEGVRAGGILDQVMHQLTIRVDPSDIPNHVDVDVNALTIGHSIHVSDLKVSEGVEVLDDEGATVATVSIPRTETPVAGVPVVEAAAEPELIRKPKEGEEEGGGEEV